MIGTTVRTTRPLVAEEREVPLGTLGYVAADNGTLVIYFFLRDHSGEPDWVTALDIERAAVSREASPSQVGRVFVARSRPAALLSTGRYRVVHRSTNDHGEEGVVVAPLDEDPRNANLQACSLEEFLEHAGD